jgi:NAD(P)H-dependent FMN reductase
MPNLTVIIASTRPGRSGLPIGNWFIEHARAQGAFTVDVADLAELKLPLLDEPNHPRLRKYQHPHTEAWSAHIDNADAIVVVTAEYNHGYPAPLKNALDFLHQEWADKPIGFVSYGGVAAGTRAVQQLKQVVTALRMVPTVEAVNIPFHAQFMDDDGRFQPNEIVSQSADALLSELARLNTALSPLRTLRTTTA